MVKKRILLTGASGTVGKETFKEMLNRTKDYEVSLFLRRSNKNKKYFAQYIDNVRIFWGTLQDYEKIEQAVNEQDIVIHVAGALPDVALINPEILFSTNVDGTQNVIKAMENQKHPPKLIYISSVAVYGDRRENSIIKLSDPIDEDTIDLYTITKIKAEKLVKESRLEYCIFRVSYVIALDVIKFRPIMFFIALDTSLEAIHAKDVGLALVNAIGSKEVWNHTFNLGGGKKCQILYKDNINDMFEIMGFGRGFLPEEAFSKQDSHCGFFDEKETTYIQSILKYQNITLEDFYNDVKKWIGIRRYLIPLVKPILRWFILRKSEFYKKFKKNGKKEN